MKGYAHIVGMMIKKYRLQQNMSQETLCKGICAVSYLSKIEKGTVICSEEILDRLFNVLGITPPSTLALDTWSLKLQEYFHHYFYLNSEEREIIFEELKAAKHNLHHSTLVFDIALAEIYEAYTIENELHTLKDECLQLLKYVDHMEDIQAYRLYHILGMIEIGISDLSPQGRHYFQLALNRRRDGVALASMSIANYSLGNYLESITIGNEGYSLLMEEGNAPRAISLCFIIAAAYANYRDTNKMLQYYNRILSLYHYTKDIFQKCHIYYNIGATYLIIKDYDKALYHLEKSLDLFHPQDHSPQEYLLLLQKLFLTHMALSQRDLAGKFLLEAKDIYYAASSEGISQSLRVSLIWMEIMYSKEDYLQDEVYLQTIKGIFEDSLKDSHHGFNMFYGQYLIEAYKAQRKYKEALKITEMLYVKNDFS